jgi:hypothetical protein
MRAKRIGPHRNNLIVRRTKCKNICAVDHANVSDIRSVSRCSAHEAAGQPTSSTSICRFFRSGGGPEPRRLEQSPSSNNGDVLHVTALRAVRGVARPRLIQSLRKISR